MTRPAPDSTPALPAHLRWALALGAWLVPRARRRAWRREWEAELYFSARRRETPVSERRLFVRALWSNLDALWIWKEELTMTRLLADIRLAYRSLRRSPAFAVVAILTLALGIGANTAIFSVVNGVLIKPLPYPESENLLSVNFTAPGFGFPIVPFSDDFYIFVRDQTRTLESVGMYNQDSVNIVGEGDPVRVSGASVTHTIFDILRVPPALGRSFTAGDSQPGAENVAIISHSLWQERYGGAPNVLDLVEDMDGRMTRIVGVMPAGFAFPGENTRVWKPYTLDEAAPATGSFSNPGLGRIAEGSSIEAVTADVAAILQRAFEANREEYPQALVDQGQFGPLIQDAKELAVGDIRQALLVILATVGIVLLIACANVANLFLVRAEAKHREVTLRAALGAGRGDVARFFLAESLMLSITGGLLGVVVAYGSIRYFTTSAPVAIPRLSAITIDARVLLFALAISVATGLIFGLAPMLRGQARDLARSLREGGRSVTHGNSLVSTRSLLVVGQVAMALILLVGSGLMLRSFGALRAVDPGFDPDGVLTVQLALGGAKYPDPLERKVFWDVLRERAEALPGVESVGAINQMPLTDERSAGSFRIEGLEIDEAAGALPPLAEKKHVMPGFFETVGIPLIEGRYIEEGDSAQDFRGAVVSTSLAQHWWPGESAIGKRITEGDDAEQPAWWEIVGVVGDVHFESLEQAADEVVYWPLMAGDPEAPFVTGSMHVTLRTSGSPTALAGPFRELLREIDPTLPIAASRPMRTILADSMARTSFTMVMLGIAAAVALTLGAIGIYGVISYIVSQRTQEIGVRLALGASRGSVQGMVVRRGMVLALLGIALGVAGALAAGNALASLLFGIQALDPFTYVSVVAALGLTSLLASWLPALRASGVDPVVALRAD